MECNRVVKVIDQIRANQQPDALFDEIVTLKNQGYLTKFESRDSLIDYGNQLTQFHQQYDQALNELNTLVSDLMRTRLDLVQSGFISKMFSKLRIGSGGSLYSKVLMLNKTIKHKQEELGFIKANLLRVTAQRDALDQSVDLFGENILVTTTGDSIASQIRGRPRFGAKEFSEFQTYLKNLDELAGKIMADIQKMIQGRNFALVWLPYLNNFGMMDLIRSFDNIVMSEYEYEVAERKMMDIILNRLLPSSQLRTNDPNYLRMIEDLQNCLRQFSISSGAVRYVFQLFVRIFQSWNPPCIQNNQYITQNVSRNVIDQSIPKLFENYGSFPNYITRLTKIIGNLDQRNPSSIQFGKVNEQTDVLALLLLGLADDPLKYNYFHPRLSAAPEVARFFAAVLTLFPWTAEETWQLMLRVEQTVLRSQSVQFMPELLEYGIMILSNVNFILAANNVDASFYIKWQTLLLPCIMGVHVNSLENQIETYLKTRPLSYITNPRPYYYSHGFYMRAYRPHYGYYGGYHHGPRAPPSHGFSRGNRYSSLHHHTIG